MYTPDWTGGVVVGDVLVAQSQSTAATFTSSAAVSLINLTGKMLLIFDVSAITNNTFELQIFGVTTNAVSGGTQVGNALGASTQTGTMTAVVGAQVFQIDLETFTPGPYMYASLTVGGSTHTAVFSLQYVALKKLV